MFLSHHRSQSSSTTANDHNQSPPPPPKKINLNFALRLASVSSCGGEYHHWLRWWMMLVDAVVE
eukprot:scaffold7810_cov89-Skeletonema_dohrnii-CCMP3373.AAC.2